MGVTSVLDDVIAFSQLPYKDRKQEICDFIDKEIFTKAPEIDTFTLHIQPEGIAWHSFTIDHTPVLEQDKPEEVTRITHSYHSYLFKDYPEYKEFDEKLFKIHSIIYDTFASVYSKKYPNEMTLKFSMPHRIYHRTIYISANIYL